MSAASGTEPRPAHPRALYDLIGSSETMRAVRTGVASAACEDGPALIVGEAGTGKSYTAQTVHLASRRASHPLLRVDCSVLSAEALLHEVLGDEAVRGGAGRVGVAGFKKPGFSRSQVQIGNEPGLREREGLIRQLAGGTLLLDNVDQAAVAAQQTLSWFLHNRSIDGRILATSRNDPGALVRAGGFDAKLAALFSGGTITLPPLGERTDDIGPLTEHFLARQAVRDGVAPKRLTRHALDLLLSCEWPGNVAQLENVIASACAVEDGGRLTAEALDPWLACFPRSQAQARSQAQLGNEGAGDFSPAPTLTLRQMERRLIEATFARCHGNRELTARALNIGVRTLSGKLREYGYPPRGGPGSNKNSENRRAA